MKRVVVKVGTHVLSEQNRLCKERILNLVEFLVALAHCAGQRQTVLLLLPDAATAGGDLPALQLVAARGRFAET